jgi:3-methyladenine DNA glycosylase AlkC
MENIRNLSKIRRISCSWIGKLSHAKMSILPKFVCLQNLKADSKIYIEIPKTKKRQNSVYECRGKVIFYQIVRRSIRYRCWDNIVFVQEPTRRFD